MESQIYNITVEILNEYTFGKYKNKNILFDSAAELLNAIQKSNIENIEILKFSLDKLIKHVDNDKCERFMELLSHRLNKEEYKKLYAQICLRKKEIEKKDIKKYIINKYESCKSDIKKEIGAQKIKEFRKASIFRKIIKVIIVSIYIMGVIS